MTSKLCAAAALSAAALLAGLGVTDSPPLAASADTATPPALASGQALYREACAYCHGASGQGDVRASAPKLWGKGNIISQSAYGSAAPLSQFIREYMPLEPVNGINPGSLSAAQAHSLAHYILARH